MNLSPQQLKTWQWPCKMADERGFQFFQRFMREKGIITKLEELGIAENDTVQLYELEFDYWKGGIDFVPPVRE